jgi:hypothetical protein
MPLPVSVVSKPGNLRIEASFSYALHGNSGLRVNQGAVRLLGRLVDSLWPDPPLRHDLELLVEGALQGDVGDMQRLESISHSWVDAAPELDRLASHSPLLQEVTRRRSEWLGLGSMGLEALSYLRSGNATPSGWQAKQTALLHEAAEPRELADFVILAPLEKLVAAASAPGKH